MKCDSVAIRGMIRHVECGVILPGVRCQSSRGIRIEREAADDHDLAADLTQRRDAIIEIKEAFEALHIPVKCLLERSGVVLVGVFMLNLHDDTFGRIGPEKVDAHVTDILSETQPGPDEVIVDGEGVPYVAAPDVDIANAVV